jgi:hypothetical protein
MLKLPFLSRLRPRSGYDVVAVIAMCAALGTGGAYAAATIGSEDVVDESLTDADIKNGSLGPAIADQSISAWKLKPSAVWGGHILDGSVTGADVDESTLGKVPAAVAADTAATATAAQTAQKAATAGSAPIEGYEVVESIPAYTHNITRIGTATCPPGKRVLGGAYRMFHPLHQDWTEIPLAMTQIINNNTQFRVTAQSIHLRDTVDGEPWILVIQATCVKAA